MTNHREPSAAWLPNANAVSAAARGSRTLPSGLNRTAPLGLPSGSATVSLGEDATFRPGREPRAAGGGTSSVPANGMPFDRQAYLDRIGYDGPVDPTPQTLADLTLAHLRAVPFENLDIVPLGRPLRLDPAGLSQKIVGERRGGFCFELNGLFALLLEGLGFDVARVACRFVEAAAETDPFDHLALLVTPPGGEPWFVDVGAGAGGDEAALLSGGR